MRTEISTETLKIIVEQREKGKSYCEIATIAASVKNSSINIKTLKE